MPKKEKNKQDLSGKDSKKVEEDVKKVEEDVKEGDEATPSAPEDSGSKEKTTPAEDEFTLQDINHKIVLWVEELASYQARNYPKYYDHCKRNIGYWKKKYYAHPDCPKVR